MRKKIFRATFVVLILGLLALAPWIIQQFSIAVRVKQLFELEYQLGNLSPATEQAIGAGTDPLAKEKLQKQLEEIYTPEKAAENFDGIIKLFKEENGHALDNRFENVDFQIWWWEGSNEKDGILTAKFVGIPKLTNKSETFDGACLGEYEVELQKSAINGQLLISNWTLKEFSNCR